MTLPGAQTYASQARKEFDWCYSASSGWRERELETQKRANQGVHQTTTGLECLMPGYVGFKVSVYLGVLRFGFAVLGPGRELSNSPRSFLRLIIFGCTHRASISARIFPQDLCANIFRILIQNGLRCQWPLHRAPMLASPCRKSLRPGGGGSSTAGSQAFTSRRAGPNAHRTALAGLRRRL